MACEERARATEELAKVKSEKAIANMDHARAVEAQAAWPMEEYKDPNTFEADAAVATIMAYNLWFGDYKKVTNAFSNLDFHRVIPMGESKEDEVDGIDEDEEGEEEQPMQATSEDEIDGDVAEVPMLDISEAVEASTFHSSVEMS